MKYQNVSNYGTSKIFGCNSNMNRHQLYRITNHRIVNIERALDGLVKVLVSVVSVRSPRRPASNGFLLELLIS